MKILEFMERHFDKIFVGTFIVVAIGYILLLVGAALLVRLLWGLG